MVVEIATEERWMHPPPYKERAHRVVLSERLLAARKRLPEQSLGLVGAAELIHHARQRVHCVQRVLRVGTLRPQNPDEWSNSQSPQSSGTTPFSKVCCSDNGTMVVVEIVLTTRAR